jgi:hypothetical protein
MASHRSPAPSILDFDDCRTTFQQVIPKVIAAYPQPFQIIPIVFLDLYSSTGFSVPGA